MKIRDTFMLYQDPANTTRSLEGSRPPKLDDFDCIPSMLAFQRNSGSTETIRMIDAVDCMYQLPTGTDRINTHIFKLFHCQT